MMHEIDDNIFIGSADDYYSVAEDSNFVFVQAAKDPFFKELTVLKGTYFVYKGNKLILNIIDAPPGYPFNHSVFVEAIKFIKANKDKKVLIHCNQGKSRAPAIACLYLGIKYDLPYVEAAKKLKYRDYNPKGVEGFLMKNWGKLKQLCR